MKVAFAGTPDFAAVALEAIYAAGHEVALVFTQPDRPSGRGMKLQPSPVKKLALDHGTPVCQPTGLKLDGKYAAEAAEAQDALERAGVDIIVVAAYGLIVPPWFLAAAPLGCLNIHGSLLPRWRGAAPIHRAIEAGDLRTGITVMQMDVGLDTGPMLIDEGVDIGPTDTTGSLHDTLAVLGGRLIVRALEMASRGELVPVAQPEQGVTYAHKIAKSESAIDWTQDAALIERRLRAFDPFPGATAVLAGETLKCWRGHVVARTADAAPGTVLASSAAGVVVACGEGALVLTEVQRPGGKRLSAAQWLQSSGVAASLATGVSFALN